MTESPRSSRSPSEPSRPPRGAPPPRRRVTARVTVVALLTLLAGLVGLAFLIPTPYRLVMAGPVTDVRRLIEPAPAPTDGALYLTTVYSDPASVAHWLFARLSPHAGLVPGERARPEHLDEAAYQRLLAAMMEESQLVAQVVALRAAGYDVAVTGEGARVQAIVAGSGAAGRLEPGDIIVAAGGRPVQTAHDLVALLGARRPGETASLDIRRDDRLLRVEVPLGASPDEPGRARMGAAVLTHRVSYQLPDEVSLQTAGVVGPSAGLVLALGVYDAVVPGDLTRGRQIAVTGTISTDGSVGAVGGVPYKVRGAEAAGAALFLVPLENHAEAAAAARSVRVVPVDTFTAALAVLADLPPTARAAEG